MRRVSRPPHPAHQGELPLVNVSQPRPISAPDGFRSFQGPPVAVRARRPLPSPYVPVGYRRQLPTPSYSHHASYHGSQDAHTASQPYQQEEQRYDTQEELMGPPAEADATPRDRPSQTSGSAITLSQTPAATTGEDITSFHAELKVRQQDSSIGALRAAMFQMLSEHSARVRENARELPQLLSSATAGVTLELQNLSRVVLDANVTRAAANTEPQPQPRAALLVEDQPDNHQAIVAPLQATLSDCEVQAGHLPKPACKSRSTGRTATRSPPIAQRKSARQLKTPARFAEVEAAKRSKPVNRRKSQAKEDKDNTGHDRRLQGGATLTEETQTASAPVTSASLKAVARRKVSFELPDDAHANSPCSPKHQGSAKKHKPSMSASAGSTMEVPNTYGPHAINQLAGSAVRQLEFNSPSSSQSTTTSSGAFDPFTAPSDDDKESAHIQQRLMRARVRRQKRFLANGLLSSSQNTFVQAVIDMQLQHSSPVTS
eukprot:jgi/Chlat1/2607/Chrsp178S02501